MDKYFRYYLKRADDLAVMEIAIDGYPETNLISEEEADAKMWQILAEICHTDEKTVQTEWFTEEITNPEERSKDEAVTN